MSSKEAPLDDPLLLACRQLARAMDLFDEAACRRLGVGRNDLRALNLLEHGPLSASTLAERLALTRTAVTSLVDRLAGAGYVSREPDPEDRRSVHIGLLAATWQAFTAVYRPLGEHVHRSTADLPERDRVVVIEALQTMSRAFDDTRHLATSTGDQDAPFGRRS